MANRTQSITLTRFIIFPPNYSNTLSSQFIRFIFLSTYLLPRIVVFAIHIQVTFLFRQKFFLDNHLKLSISRHAFLSCFNNQFVIFYMCFRNIRSLFHLHILLSLLCYFGQQSQKPYSELHSYYYGFLHLVQIKAILLQNDILLIDYKFLLNCHLVHYIFVQSE